MIDDQVCIVVVSKDDIDDQKSTASYDKQIPERQRPPGDGECHRQRRTIFAHRLSNEADQKTVRTWSADCPSGLLEFLSFLGDGEALAVGQGVSMLMRVSFTRLTPEKVPSCSGASFSRVWRPDHSDVVDLNEIVARWRNSHGEDARAANWR